MTTEIKLIAATFLSREDGRDRRCDIHSGDLGACRPIHIDFVARRIRAVTPKLHRT
jgi:hypothetical protein